MKNIFVGVLLFAVFVFGIVGATLDLAYTLDTWGNAPPMPITIWAWHSLLIMNMVFVYIVSITSFFVFIFGASGVKWQIKRN